MARKLSAPITVSFSIDFEYSMFCLIYFVPLPKSTYLTCTDNIYKYFNGVLKNGPKDKAEKSIYLGLSSEKIHFL